jgi:serine/threonine protein kinase
VGTGELDELETFIPNGRALAFIKRKIGFKAGIDFAGFFSEVVIRRQVGITADRLFDDKDVECVDLLRKMLTINPEQRITAREALYHPCFSDFHGLISEASPNPFTFPFDNVDLCSEDVRRFMEKEEQSLSKVFPMY